MVGCRKRFVVLVGGACGVVFIPFPLDRKVDVPTMTALERARELDGPAHDKSCLQCFDFWVAAYAGGKSWDAYVSEQRDVPVAIEEAKQAQLVFKDPSKRTFVPEDVAVEETLELILDRSVVVYTDAQVRALAGNRRTMPAPERLAGCVTVTAPKETGDGEETLYCFADPGRPRKGKLRSRVVVSRSKTVFAGSSQCRPTQGKEQFQRYCVDAKLRAAVDALRSKRLTTLDAFIAKNFLARSGANNAGQSKGNATTGAASNSSEDVVCSGSEPSAASDVEDNASLSVGLDAENTEDDADAADGGGKVSAYHGDEATAGANRVVDASKVPMLRTPPTDCHASDAGRSKASSDSRLDCFSPGDVLLDLRVREFVWGRRERVSVAGRSRVMVSGGCGDG